MPVCLSVYCSSFCLFTRLSSPLSVCLSVCLLFCLSVCVRLPSRLPVSVCSISLSIIQEQITIHPPLSAYELLHNIKLSEFDDFRGKQQHSLPFSLPVLYPFYFPPCVLSFSLSLVFSIPSHTSLHTTLTGHSWATLPPAEEIKCGCGH